MEIKNLSKDSSIINQYMAEIRDAEYQKNRLLFRNNITRIGECEAYEISKALHYEEKEVTTPLGISRVSIPKDHIVLGTIFRAGLPFHTGFLNIFDHLHHCYSSGN
jgi:uracil phosphoribosyltransferase